MSNNQSRYENRDKRRKANLVLNILIAIVSILIVVVAANLFINSPSSKDVSKDSETAQKQESPASGKTEKKSDEDIKDSKKDTSDSEKDSEKSSDSDSKKDDSSSKSDDSDSDSSSDTDDPLKDAKVTEGGSSSDVEKTYENPDWKAVGTEQTGEHAATYDSSSQDWAEMLKAISYATGVSTDNMTVLWLGNNGSPQDAKGKILDKTTGDKYQVTITWVDEKGWKPTKVEKLK
ncbi:YrrS family protein [Bacillus spizizenii]|nr:YrrS family protein [Bacillus spizizenii]MCY8227307.1 YrrS family protein [Bacillus spizizenii]MCY8890906.1 YrrS family protein [Bacillus spizizenii]MEC0534200.1 YrrS family protein [Bacillus spizizenii]MEC0842539.1 YrrS family protein [Bacillus spizizenii]